MGFLLLLLHIAFKLLSKNLKKSISMHKGKL